jgi:hypothetical protein
MSSVSSKPDRTPHGALIIANLLNVIARTDRAALRCLIESRVPCNEALADDTHAVVSEFAGVPIVGGLGILNGLVSDTDYRVTMRLGDSNDQLDFLATRWPIQPGWTVSGDQVTDFFPFDPEFVLDRLNSFFAADPVAIQSLLCPRVPCSPALAEHPTIIVTSPRDGRYVLDLQGLLNGLVTGAGKQFVWTADENRIGTGFKLVDLPEAAQVVSLSEPLYFSQGQPVGNTRGIERLDLR